MKKLFLVLLMLMVSSSAFAYYRTWTTQITYDCGYQQCNGYGCHRVPRTCYATCYYTDNGYTVSYNCR